MFKKEDKMYIDSFEMYDVSPYGCKLFFTKNKDLYSNALYEMSGDEDEASKISGDSCHGCFICLDNKNSGVVLMLGWFDDNVASLAHECIHAVFSIFGMHGVEVDSDNNEHFAYQHTHMMEYILSNK